MKQLILLVPFWLFTIQKGHSQIQNLVPGGSFEDPEIFGACDVGASCATIPSIYSGGNTYKTDFIEQALGNKGMGAEGLIFQPNTTWKLKRSTQWNKGLAYYITDNSFRFYPDHSFEVCSENDPPTHGNVVAAQYICDNSVFYADYYPALGNQPYYEENVQYNNETGVMWSLQPNNCVFGNEYPAHGNSYIALFVHNGANSTNNGTRLNETISCELTSPTIIGQEYKFECKVSVPDNIENASNGCEYKIVLAESRTSGGGPSGSTKTIENGIVTQTNNWKHIEWRDIINKEYQYLFIKIKKSSIATGASGQATGMYLDDVQLYQSCKPPGECISEYHDKISLTVNERHSDESAFTVHGLDRVEELYIKLGYTINGQQFVEFEETFISPPPKWSWEGPSTPISLPSVSTMFYEIGAKNKCDSTMLGGIFELTTLTPTPVGGAVIDYVDLYAEQYFDDIFATNINGQIVVKNLNNPTLNEDEAVNGQQGFLFGLFVNYARIEIRTTGPNSSLIRTIQVQNPSNNIGWDGLDDSGNLMPQGTYNVRVFVKNVCFESEYNPVVSTNLQFNGNFFSVFPITSVTKPYYECPFNFTDLDYTYPTEACCPYGAYQYFENVNIGFQQEFKVLDEIEFGTGVNIVGGADVLFTAANIINISNVNIEPYANATFEIKPCVKSTNANAGDPTEEYVDTEFIDEPIEVENYVDMDIEISPNPTAGTIKINIISDFEKASITVLDMNGRIQTSTQTRARVNNLNLSFLAKGIYTVRIETPTESYTEKIILK